MNPIRLNLALIPVCLAAWATHARAADWPRFRGPNGEGISYAKTVPTKWTKQDYNWVVDLPGGGHGSPVIVGNRIYVVSGKPENAQRLVTCIHSQTGKQLWTKSFASRRHRLHPANSYGSSTPAADEQGVVVTWGTPKSLILKALDRQGKTVWSRDLGPCVAINGAGTSPIIVGDLVVLMNVQMDPNVMIKFGVLPKTYPDRVPKESFFIAVDRKTGKTRWRVTRKTYLAGYATPCLRKLADSNRELVFLDSFYGLTGVDLRTGKINWETNKLLPTRTVASPIVAGELILGSHGRGVNGDQLFAIRPGPAKSKPKVAFEVRKAVPLVPTPIAIDGHIFLWADNGVVTCLQMKDGKLVWRKRVGGNYYASPVWVNGRLYGVTRGGNVAVISAGKKFKLLARVPLGERSYATPAVASGAMYFRTEKKLFSLGGK